MSQEIEAVSYCVGMSLGGSLLQQNLEGISTAKLSEAIQDAFDGKPMKYTPEQANEIIQNYTNQISNLETMLIEKDENLANITNQLVTSIIVLFFFQPLFPQQHQ